MPKPVTIIGRTSIITNAFINGIIPCIAPSEAEVAEVLSLLGMDEEKVRCAYCGDPMTEWDHFRPLIVGKKATGYISEIQNLVPSCGKCNQSKGNKDWRTWMLGDAERSPKTRGVTDLEDKVARLEKYERWSRPTKLDFEELVGSEIWDRYWNTWESLTGSMAEAQALSNEIKRIVKKGVSDEDG